MPLEIHKRSRAREDLLEIWLYSHDTRSANQADRYLDRLDEGISRLSENPFLGSDAGTIRRGYRKLTVERHLVFYTVTEERIEIVRVLHAQMDAVSQLDE